METRKEATLKNCENCRKKNLFRKTGRFVTVGGLQRREMVCRCGWIQLEEAPQEEVIPPKVLYFDIETSLIEMKVQTFDLRVRSGWLDWHEIEKSFYIISWAAAWVNDKPIKILSGAVTGEEAKERNDGRMLQGLWKLMEAADYVVGHNSKSFDVKKVETRFMLNHMPAPAEFRQVDTLQIAKKRFRSESNALAYWSKLFGGNPKDHMVREDWIAVNEGCQKTINKMRKYNKGDVREGVNDLLNFMRYIESNGYSKLFR